MAVSLTPQQVTLRARTAAYARWATCDPIEATAPAREAFMQRFVDQVDPDRVLPEVERNRRATAARKAHMSGLALKSSRARAARKAAS